MRAGRVSFVVCLDQFVLDVHVHFRSLLLLLFFLFLHTKSTDAFKLGNVVEKHFCSICGDTIMCPTSVGRVERCVCVDDLAGQGGGKFQPENIDDSDDGGGCTQTSRRKREDRRCSGESQTGLVSLIHRARNGRTGTVYLRPHIKARVFSPNLRATPCRVLS